MLSEYFVDVCIAACCSDIPPQIRQQKNMFECIESIVDWYKKEIPEDARPVEFRDKVDILFWLSKYRKGNPYNFDIMMAKLSEWKLGSFVPVLQELKKEFSEERFTEVYKMVLNRRKLCDVIHGKSELQQLLSDIDSCSLTDDEEVIEKWEKQLQKAHDDLQRIKKIESTDSASSLDVVNDSYNAMFSTMMDSVEESQILKTGFKYLENMLVTGGFENRRLYLIGGSSGIGKSTMLINLICNAIKLNKAELAGAENTYLYITAENLIDETWIRFFCCLTGTPHQDFMSALKTLKYETDLENLTNPEAAERKLNDFYSRMKAKVSEELVAHKANVVFKYIPSGVSSTRDVLTIVDSVSKDYNLRAVFIDYLDLFISGRNLEQLRFELALVTQDLKNIGIDYNLPVITATQLNREGYNPDAEPKLTQMGESMEKVNKSDFVLFLQDGKTKTFDVEGVTYKQIRMTVLKQRNGRTGDTTSVAMASLRGSRSIFNFRMEERENPTLIQDQKEVKQKGKSMMDTAPTVSIKDYHHDAQDILGVP